MSHFLYKLIPPRPSFDKDMSDAERAIMGAHAGYWQELVEQGTAIVFGPVSDPAGVWGLAVVDAGSEQEVRELGLADPAVTSELARFEVCAMPLTVVGRVASAA